MKLKLKVNKSLKRDLKVTAEKHSLERADFIKQVFLEHIEANKEIWENKVDDYPALLEDRQNRLEALKANLEEIDISQEDKRAQMMAFYKDNHMYRVFYNKKKKYENIILQLEDTDYNALCLISEYHSKALELYAVDILNKIVKQP